MTLLTNPVRASLSRVRPHGIGTEVGVTKIADTHTPVPGGHGDFAFFTFPSIGADGVAFRGAGPSQPQNLYLSSSGTLELLVRVGAPYPELGAFTALSLPTVGDDQVAFWGGGLVGGPGIYTTLPNQLRVVANGAIPVPGGSGNFTSFESAVGPGISANRVAFVGSDANAEPGVYVGIPAQSSVELIANIKTPLPGGPGTFTTLSNAAIDGNRVAFFGSNQSVKPIRAGIYSVEIGGALVKVADTATPAPDGSGDFSGFTAPTVSGDTVACTALTASNGGLYAWDNGTLATVANLGTPVPGGEGTFSGFGNAAPSSYGNVIVFSAFTTEGVSGIYASAGGKLSKLIDENDTIEGQAILYLGLDTHQASGGVVAFYAVLADKVFGIYTLPVAG